MRTNTFGEKYCHTADELRRVLDDKCGDWYVNDSDLEVAPEDEILEGQKACQAEVRENESGDTLCWVEADTKEAVEAILRECKVEIV